MLPHTRFLLFLQTSHPSQSCVWTSVSGSNLLDQYPACDIIILLVGGLWSGLTLLHPPSLWFNPLETNSALSVLIWNRNLYLRLYHFLYLRLYNFLYLRLYHFLYLRLYHFLLSQTVSFPVIPDCIISFISDCIISFYLRLDHFLLSQTVSFSVISDFIISFISDCIISIYLELWVSDFGISIINFHFPLFLPVFRQHAA